MLPSKADDYPYYKVGTRVGDIGPGSSVPTGWIVETRSPTPIPQADSTTSDDWLSVDVAEQFVAIKSRRLRSLQVGNDTRFVHDYSNESKWFLSEGEAAGGTGYFFYARGIQPCVAGRWQNPADVAPDEVLFGPHPDVPRTGIVSQMYQWLDLTDIKNLQTSWQSSSGVTLELYLYASVLQRSLYRESTVDQGWMRVELYDRDITTGELAKRPQSLDATSHYSHSGLFPLQQHVDAAIHLEPNARKRNWSLRTTSGLMVPADMNQALILLEGQANAGWDIDAYFADVKVWWEMKVQSSGS